MLGCTALHVNQVIVVYLSDAISVLHLEGMCTGLMKHSVPGKDRGKP